MATLMENKKRTIHHRKSKELEAVFPEMEHLLGNAEKEVLKKCSKPQMPVVFIVGCARSGSTLLYQFLADTEAFGYPSNLMSRFYYAPYIGARVQQMLIDFDEKGEIFPKTSLESFKSELGKTFGPKQPHEFWYFWDRFFKFNELQQLSKTQLSQVDWKCFLKECHALEMVFNKPLLMKAMKMNWHITQLKEKFENAHFIYIKRDILYNAQSLLQAREKFFGNQNEWYSFKPHNYQEIKQMSPVAQVVEQVISTNQAIENQLVSLPVEDYSVVDYEYFCSNPRKLLNDLLKKINIKSLKNHDVSFHFKSSDIAKVTSDVLDEIKEYLAHIGK